MNNKGIGLTALLMMMIYYYGLTGTAVIIGSKVNAAAIIGICVWHIPAWEAAKDAHCEKEYQSGNMQCGYQKK